MALERGPVWVNSGVHGVNVVQNPTHARPGWLWKAIVQMAAGQSVECVRQPVSGVYLLAVVLANVPPMNDESPK